MSETSNYPSEQPRRFTAPSVGEVHEDIVDRRTSIFRRRKVANPALRETVRPPEAATPAPDESWRNRGEAPPAGTGINRSTGKKSSFVDSLNKLQGRN